MARGWLIGMLWLALVFGPMSAHAQTCTFTISNGSLGSVSPIATQNTDVIINADINCSGFTQPYVRVCASLGSRGMTGPGAKLNYELFIDSQRTRPVGYDGKAFLPHLQPGGNRVSARVGDTMCSADIPFNDGDAMRTIGPYICQKSTTP